MRVLSDATVAILNTMRFRPEAKRTVSWLPLGSIYWEDEMPDWHNLALSKDERYTVIRLFAIRFKVWDNQQLSASDSVFWEAARAEAKNWALFQRLVLSEEDRAARKQAEKDAEEGFEAFFGDADQIELKKDENGLQEFSATFDLTKERSN